MLVGPARTGRTPRHILEVGCGTGSNLPALCRTFPAATIVGLDLSADMLEKARKKVSPWGPRVRLLRRSYDQPLPHTPPFDLILFSYVLSMMNPGWDRALLRASRDLAPRGMVAVVDFHQSPSAFFRRWMRLNHVWIDDQRAACLHSCFRPLFFETRRAYGGCWTYLAFIGERYGDC